MAIGTARKGRWVLNSAQEGTSSLRYEDSLTFEATQMAPDEVLVDIHAASLNYREIAIAKVYTYIHPHMYIQAAFIINPELTSIKGQPDQRHPSPGNARRDPRIRWGRRRRRSRFGCVPAILLAEARREGGDTHVPTHRR